MDIWGVLLISVILALDAFTVSVCIGACAKNNRLTIAVKSSSLFGLFQGVMPVIGFFIGVQFSSVLKEYDHWVAFLLLSGIGIKFIYESIKKANQCECYINYNSWKLLLTLAIATSIDALVIGFTFAYLKVNLFIAALVIAIVTFVISFIGSEFGNKLKNINVKKIDVFAGVALILLGFKILLEHTIFYA